MQRCVRCLRDYHHPVETCKHCGWKFSGVSEAELPGWFAEVQAVLEGAYLQAETPWGQSGKGGGYRDWEAGRRCVAEAIDGPGAFLDVGCANGYLLACLLEWSAHAITPYGVDISPSLAAMARQRLPAYAANIYAANAFDWQPPRRFDYVRLNPEYVPGNWQQAFLRRAAAEMLRPGGKLLVAEYASSRHAHQGPWVDDVLRGWGMVVSATHHGYTPQGHEIARVAVVPYSGSS